MNLSILFSLPLFALNFENSVSSGIKRSILNDRIGKILKGGSENYQSIVCPQLLAVFENMPLYRTLNDIQIYEHLHFA